MERPYYIYVLSVLKVWKSLFVMGQLKETHGQKNDLNCVFSLTSTRVEVPTVVAWQLGHISLE